MLDSMSLEIYFDVAHLLHCVTGIWLHSLSSKIVCNEGFKEGKNTDTSGQCSKEICSLASARVTERNGDKETEMAINDGMKKKIRRASCSFVMRNKRHV